MILQCDQCHTKFRLDDSKLKPGGVKVRCSKCRHVFLAGAEVKQEESDFDAILSGLGAPVAQQGPEAAEPGPVEEPAGFGFEAALQSAVAPAAAAPAAPAPEAPEASLPAQAGDEIADFSAFDFPTEPSESVSQPTVPGEFSAADFELPASELEPPSAQAGGTDYGDFSFDEEPAQLKEKPAGSAGSLDFGEFSFTSEIEPEPQPEPGRSPAAELDFGEFEFSDEPSQGAPEPAKTDDLDFGEFSFEEEPAVAASAQPSIPAQEEAGFEFGDFSFSEEPAVPEAQSQGGGGEPQFGEFSFEEEPVLKEPVPASATSVPEAPFEFPAAQPAAAAGFTTGDSFDMNEFSFAGSELADESSATSAALTAEAHAFPTMGVAPVAAHSEQGGEPAHVAGLSALASTTLAGTALAGTPVAGAKPEKEPEDFDLGPVPTRVPDDFKLDEEEEGLPPLSISSRRKGRSLLTASVVAVSVLVIVALSVAGLYLMQSGPAAFDKVGLGFVAHWFGVETPEEGRITVKVQQASYYQNKDAGELFVVTGEAVNSFRKARAPIHVRVNLYDKNGKVLLQKAAYCGNRLTPEQLTTLPWSKIESIMNNPFGDSLANLGVQPGKSIGFVVAVPNVPKEAADFGVEVLDSAVAGK